MNFKSIVFENFRTFKEKSYFNDLKQVNAIVGPNEAGKSNIFEVLCLLRWLSYNGLNEMRRSPDYYFFDRSIKNKIAIEVQLELFSRDRHKIVQLLDEQCHLFANIKFDENDLFKFIRYLFEIQDVLDLGIHPLTITAILYF